MSGPIIPLSERMATALTIAGSDSSGGAGLQADLRAFEALGVHGASVVTMVTVQSTRGVFAVAPMSADLVSAQLDAVLGDMAVRAVKTGALGDSSVIRAVAKALGPWPHLPLVVDPVLRPTLGRALLNDEGLDTLIHELFPRACLVTPNLMEAQRLTGRHLRDPSDVRTACERIVAMGAASVLVKGGHSAGFQSVDTWFDGEHLVRVASPRLAIPPMHGLGCTLSALITGLLAHGEKLQASIEQAHAMLQRALRTPRMVGEGLALPGRLQPK